MRSVGCSPFWLFPTWGYFGSMVMGAVPDVGGRKSVPPAASSQPYSIEVKLGIEICCAAREPLSSAVIAARKTAPHSIDHLFISFPPWPADFLEIRFFCSGHGHHALIEMVTVVLRTNGFNERTLFHAAIALDRVPGRGESARVLDMDIDFERLALIDHLEALDHMQLLRVRREVVVDICPCRQADRVHHQGVAFIMSDRLAKP